MNLSKYYYIGKINFINSMVYIYDRLSQALFITLIIYVFSQLWSVMYQNTPVIKGFTIVQMLWYFTMTESITVSLKDIISVFAKEIQSGNIANYLNKPYNYIAYLYSSSIGSALFGFLLIFLFGGTYVFFAFGPLSFNFINLPLLIIIIFLAITLNFTLMAFLGSFCFWFEDSRALYFIYSKIVFTIGGMLIPLELYPVWLANISKLLPFSYVAYFPAKLFVNFNLSQFFSILLVQILWIVLFISLTYLVYKKGEKKVVSNGG